MGGIGVPLNGSLALQVGIAFGFNVAPLDIKVNPYWATTTEWRKIPYSSALQRA